jgi:hypothetical protein
MFFSPARAGIRRSTRPTGRVGVCAAEESAQSAPRAPHDVEDLASPLILDRWSYRSRRFEPGSLNTIDEPGSISSLRGGVGTDGRWSNLEAAGGRAAVARQQDGTTGSPVAWDHRGSVSVGAVMFAGFLAGYCGSTRRSYATDLRLFAAWCGEANLPLFGVRRAHLELFGRWMEENGKMRSTVARRLSTLASFYRYCEQEGLIERNPAANVRRPKVDYESPTLGLDRNELGAFLVQSRTRLCPRPCPGLAAGPQRPAHLRGAGRRHRRPRARTWSPHPQDPPQGRQASGDPAGAPDVAGGRPVHRRADDGADLRGIVKTCGSAGPADHAAAS